MKITFIKRYAENQKFHELCDKNSISEDLFKWICKIISQWQNMRTLSFIYIVISDHYHLSTCHAVSTKFPDSLSLAINPYHPSLLAGSLGCILCPHRVDVCKSLLVSQHWYTHTHTHTHTHMHIYIYIYTVMREEGPQHFFIKMYLTHFILKRGWISLGWFVRWEA